MNRYGLIILIIFSLSLISFVNVNAAQIQTTTISTSKTNSTINLNSTLLPINMPYIPTVSSHIDIGSISYKTTLSGFSFNVTDSQIMTIGLPNTCLVSSILYNKSVTSLQCVNLNFFYKPNGYEANIIISGISTGLQICIPVSGVGGNVNYNSTNNIVEANVGSDILDWSDIPNNMSPVFNNNQLCFTPPLGIYLIDPLAIDGAGSCTPVALTCNASLTTSNSPDVIIVSEHADGNDCTTPTAIGLTFTLRVNSNGGDGDCAAEYYAIASGTFSGNIVCTWTSSISQACNVFGISGANTASPFDTNAAIPCSSNGSVLGDYPTCVISTNNANDFIITGVSSGNGHAYTAPSGYTISSSFICGTSMVNKRMCDSYNIVSSTYTSFSLIWGALSDTFWDMYVDAIVMAVTTLTQPIKICVSPNGAPTTTFNLSGASVSPTTIATDCNTYNFTVSTGGTLSVNSGSLTGTSRYCFSDRGVCVNIWSFTVSTSLVTNTTYYQLGQNYSATPETPNNWDGAYVGTTFGYYIKGTYLGTSNAITTCVGTIEGTSITYCETYYLYHDYDLAVTCTSTIGNTWNVQSPSSFTDTTGGNHDNCNYIQSSSSNSIYTNDGLLYLFLLSATYFGIIEYNKRSILK